MLHLVPVLVSQGALNTARTGTPWEVLAPVQRGPVPPLGQTPTVHRQGGRTKRFRGHSLEVRKGEAAPEALGWGGEEWLSTQPQRGCVSPEPALLDGWPMKQAQAPQATWAPASPNRGNSRWCQTPSTPKSAAPVWPCQSRAPSGHRPGAGTGWNTSTGQPFSAMLCGT